YEYDWDTTTYTNGYHTIEAYGYDENQNVGPAQVMRIFVNNPGGQTQVRTDLKDGKPAAQHKSPPPTLLAPKPPKKSGVDVGDLGVPNPYLPSSTADTKAMHSAVPTKPVDIVISEPRSAAASTPRRPAKAAIRLAKRANDLIATEALGDQQLSDPFV